MNKYRVKRNRNKPFKKPKKTHNKDVNVYTDSDLRLVLINRRIVLEHLLISLQKYHYNFILLIICPFFFISDPQKEKIDQVKS